MEKKKIIKKLPKNKKYIWFSCSSNLGISYKDFLKSYEEQKTLLKNSTNKTEKEKLKK
ncbi:MAG: hypothetical protein M1168_03120 [Candidatus Marsarchaeota archaeon]|nr:hypothetical protein [Candidatus Marsarchaeota archaeon]MCL5094946.1 hypothetical protein [Candidatus Marsarchaeota archaeon]